MTKQHNSVKTFKRLLSLGAGKQSSCLLMMSEHGILPRLDAALFSDTGAEPLAVYEYLEWLKAHTTIPIITVMKNDGLEKNVINGIGVDAWRIAQPPFFVKNNDGDGTDEGGTLWRICTREFKLEVLQKEVRRLLGFGHGERVKDAHAEQWIGISMDEASRMKPARVKWMTNKFPLIDMGMTRNDCVKWMLDQGYPEPPKSACYFCPYHSNAYWREMKMNESEEFDRAVEFDHTIRSGKLKGVKGDVYLHRSMKPLDEIDFRNAEDRGQVNMFENECEGMCGL